LPDSGAVGADVIVLVLAVAFWLLFVRTPRGG